MTDEPTTRVIEFNQGSQKYRVTIDANDRVTYGQIAPGSAGGKFGPNSGGGGGYALRIYRGTSKDITRAVFSGVTSFREIGLRVEQQAVRSFGSDEWKIDDGSYTGKRAETVERRWVDLDEPLTDPDADIPFETARKTR